MADQPAPTTSPESQPVMPAVLAGLEGYASESRAPLEALLRRQEVKGLAAYGTRLHTHNGRDALRDCAEELADALMYATQAALEQGAGGAQWPPWLAKVRHAALTLAKMAAWCPACGDPLWWDEETPPMPDDEGRPVCAPCSTTEWLAREAAYEAEVEAQAQRPVGE